MICKLYVGVVMNFSFLKKRYHALFICLKLFYRQEPTGRKTGKGNYMEDNKNMGTNAQGAENAQNDEGTQSAGPSEKMFTQDDVNRIVGERLARVKNTQASVESLEREKDLDLRERKLNAREKLADFGISKDLLPLVNCASEDTMKESIALIAEHFGKGKTASNAASGYRVSMSSGSNCNGSGYGKDPSDDDIRVAMGLKGK